jgi:hypothetical protein
MDFRARSGCNNQDSINYGAFTAWIYKSCLTVINGTIQRQHGIRGGNGVHRPDQLAVPHQYAPDRKATLPIASDNVKSFRSGCSALQGTGQATTFWDSTAGWKITGQNWCLSPAMVTHIRSCSQCSRTISPMA